MNSDASTATPLRVAIIGSGPSGFYTAEALLDAERPVEVHMFERLPTPFGLVRFGVAPDHPKLKSTAAIFEKIAERPGFQFFGNVTVGRDLGIEELRQHYHALVFCSGAESDRRLGIPGEDLQGSHTATEFVGWYNGHPDYRDHHFDLSSEAAVVIGQGNVAADVARILSAPIEKLAQTDMASHALEALHESKIKVVHVIGRRGPAQAKFTAQELRELGELLGVDVEIRSQDLDLNPESLQELADRKNFGAAKNVDIFRSWNARVRSGDQPRRIVFHFCASPLELVGNGRVEKMRLSRNRLAGPAFAQEAADAGEAFEIPCGLVFRSIGYKGRPIAGLPFEERKGVVPNEMGRVNGVPGTYVAGWIKRGPSGIIGTNRACAMQTVETLLKDFPEVSAPLEAAPAIETILAERRVRTISFAEWKKLDAIEVAAGAPQGKPREKLTRVQQMLEYLI